MTSVVAGWDFFNNNIHNEYQLIVYTAKRMGIITIISSIGDWSIKYTYLGLRIDMRSADKQDYIDCLMRLMALVNLHANSYDSKVSGELYMLGVFT